MKTIKTLWIAALLLLVSTSVQAQCTFRNTAFKSGEFLTYNLYYNWKFVWVKAGNASMSIVQSTHKGKPAYRGSLVTRGNKKVDDFFVLRDTLLCYSGTDLAPLYFRKGAREGKRYTVMRYSIATLGVSVICASIACGVMASMPGRRCLMTTVCLT